VERGHTRIPEPRCEDGRVTGGSRDEGDLVLDDEVEQPIEIPNKVLCDIEPPRLVRELSHGEDFARYGIELARRRLDDPQSAGLGDRGGELGAGDPAHRGLHDRNLDAEITGDAIVER
jgi:hypothetical protein